MAHHDSRTVFRESLRIAIALSGKTRQQVADAAGIHVTTLHRILAGRRDASMTTFFALADATGVNPIRLIDSTMCKECMTS